MRISPTLSICLLLAASSPLTRAALPAGAATFFENKIRPVLAQDCYECHSASGKKKGGLVLDSRPGWQAGGESGDVIIPGKANESLFMKAIRHHDPDLKMPKAGAKLDDKVIADFERWINMGAPDPRDTPPSKYEVLKQTDWKAVLERRKKESWCFQPVKNPPLPVVKNTAWSEHPVDRFILSRIEKEGLTAAAPTDAATVIRRLSYVITGLAPTPQELSAFKESAVRNPQSAIEALVDRLLASPRFGERWARHWMDWVRYAESYGSEGDPPIPYAWRYRDYLIRAFNNNVPYPQMLREAIAGDLLPKPRIKSELGINESALGIGHLRMVLHGFSPTDTLDEMVTFTDNQIDVVTKAFQGLTVSCARCHNHKFDAISQTDFYSLFGIFSSTHPAVIDVNAPDSGKAERAELVKLKAQIKAVVGREWLKAAESLPKTEVKKETKSTEPLKQWDLRKDKWFTDGNAVKQGATRAGEFSVALDKGKVIARIHPSGVFSDLISTKERGVLMSERFKCEGGTLWIRSAGGGGAKAKYVVQNYPRTGTVHRAITFGGAKEEVLGWQRLDLDYWKGDVLFIQLATASDMPVEIKADERSWFGVTDVVITKGETPPTSPIAGDPREAVEAWMKNEMSDAQAELLDSLLRSGKLPNDEKLVAEAAPLLEKYRAIETKLPMPTRAPGVLEADAHNAPLFVRGDHKQPAELVPRRFLDGIDPTPYRASNSGRLQLAESLSSPSNPLTSRVIVNRIWHHVFGRGIVATTDNFGRLGELPTHPELLDFLATRFADSGGSMKDMVKFLVTSKTFQLDDRASAGVAEKDPDNKLFSHFTVRRLEAEAIRDSIISLTGKLDGKMYGESVAGSDMRRSVYVKVIRNNLDDFLSVFDAPVPTSTNGRRDATNVPAQSLTMLNSLRTKDWAARWGQRISAQGSSEERVRLMFAEALGRAPSKLELEGCLAFVGQSARAGEDDTARLAKLDEETKALRNKVEAVLAPARARLAVANGKKLPAKRGPFPEPYAEWDFEDGLNDLKGKLHLKLEGNAHITNGMLVLDGGKSLARTKALPNTLTAKTFEAWVMLDNLDQRGGGLLTLQDLKGNAFDSIVFAEKDARCWLAGSNNFSRTVSFNGPPDQEAAERAVHVAIVYQADGTITGYRDGVPYGASYKSKGPEKFEANACEVLIGCRHGNAGGNRMLHGRVLRARLYDRALKAEEIAASRTIEDSIITDSDVVAALNEAQRNEVRKWQSEISELNGQSNTLREQVGRVIGGDQVWSSLALSLINLKEFIYLK